MSAWAKISSFTLVLEVAGLLAGCGGGGAGGGDGGGASPARVPGGDETAFVPEVEHALDATAGDTRGLKLVAATLAQFDDEKIWLIAVRNEGTQLVCDVSVSAVFQDSSMTEVLSSQAWVQAAMHRIENWSGLEPCLATGEVGVGMGGVLPGQVEAPIHRVVYRPRGRAWETGTKLSDVTLDNIVLEDPTAAATFVTGTMTNRGTNAVQSLTALLYPLNKVGRPFSIGLAGSSSLPAGSKLDFRMAVHGPVGRYAAFAQYTYGAADGGLDVEGR